MARFKKGGFPFAKKGADGGADAEGKQEQRVPHKGKKKHGRGKKRA